MTEDVAEPAMAQPDRRNIADPHLAETAPLEPLPPDDRLDDAAEDSEDDEDDEDLGDEKPIRLLRIAFTMAAIALTGASAVYYTHRRPEAPMAPRPVLADDPGKPIPLVLGAGVRSRGLVLTPRLSRIGARRGKPVYRFAAVLVNKGHTELRHVALQLRLLGPRGRVLGFWPIEALAPHGAILRPGDHVVFAETRPAVSIVTSARFDLVEREETPAASAYRPAAPAVLAWGVDRPARFNLAVGERGHGVVNTGGKTYAQATFELRNTGKAPINRLNLQVKFMNKAGQVLARADHDVIAGPGLALMPKEKRVIKLVEAAPPGFHHDRLRVVAIE